ncbi:hypothetical protein QN416_25630, partial [Glaciimonas sp. Cout2]
GAGSPSRNGAVGASTASVAAPGTVAGASVGAIAAAATRRRRDPNRPLRFLVFSLSSTITGALLDRFGRPRHPSGYSLVREKRLRVHL